MKRPSSRAEPAAQGSLVRAGHAAQGSLVRAGHAAQGSLRELGTRLSSARGLAPHAA